MGKKTHKKETKVSYVGVDCVTEHFNRCRQPILENNKMAIVWGEVTCVRCLSMRVEKEVKKWEEHKVENAWTSNDVKLPMPKWNRVK